MIINSAMECNFQSYAEQACFVEFAYILLRVRGIITIGAFYLSNIRYFKRILPYCRIFQQNTNCAINFLTFQTKAHLDVLADALLRWARGR